MATHEKKIEAKKAQMEVLQKRITNDRRRVAELEQDISRLEAQKIIGLANALNIPLAKLEETIRSLKGA